MTSDGIENAIVSSPDSLCPRCGLSKRHRGSITFWIFQNECCQCDSLRAETAVKDEGKHILNDRYELLECVGRGGIGFVYKARDLQDGEVVALKIMRPELSQSQSAVRRVMREVSIVSQMSHSNLGRVYGYGQERGGAPYLVMDFVDGPNLETLLKSSGSLKQSIAVDVFFQICSGLVCAHSHGIIHRDVKPSNIIINENSDGALRATIVDFGFARVLHDASVSAKLTKEGDVFGTPAYMSPEQCLGQEVDERSDIYSLGCLMYEVLLSTPPFSGENVLSVIARQIREEPRSLRQIDPTIREDIESVVMKCLSKEPVLRYQSATELRADLDKVKRGEPILVKRTKKLSADKNAEAAKSLRTTEHVYRRLMSMVGAVALAAVIAGGIAGVAVWTMVQRQTASPVQPSASRVRGGLPASDSAPNVMRPTASGDAVPLPAVHQQTPRTPPARHWSSMHKSPSAGSAQREQAMHNHAAAAAQKPKTISNGSAKSNAAHNRVSNSDSAPLTSGSNWSKLKSLREHP